MFTDSWQDRATVGVKKLLKQLDIDTSKQYFILFSKIVVCDGSEILKIKQG